MRKGERDKCGEEGSCLYVREMASLTSCVGTCDCLQDGLYIRTKRTNCVLGRPLGCPDPSIPTSLSLFPTIGVQEVSITLQPVD